MSHLTYPEAIITGIVQGVSELFPISSLGHNVLIPALVGGQWAKDLSVTAKDSPYLAFVVGLHVATALALIAYFWRDWLRIIRGFFTSIRDRTVSDADQRLAWMIIIGTIPVGLVGVVLQKVITSVFAQPMLTALFLAANGGVLLYSERQRRLRAATPDGGDWDDADWNGGGWDSRGWDDGGRQDEGWDDRNDPRGIEGHGWNQQPGQQQWQGPDDPRYEDPRFGRPRDPRYPQEPPAGGPPPAGPGQGPSFTPSFTPADPAPAEPAPAGPRFQPHDGRDPRYPQDGPAAAAGGAPSFTPAARPGSGPDAGEERIPVRDKSERRGAGPQPWGDDPGPWGPDDDFGSRRRRREPDDGFEDAYDDGDDNVAADRRLATMTFRQAILIGAWQIAALLPGISRDGIVTIGGMRKGLTRQDAVRFSFLLSAPVILAAGVLKLGDLTGPEGHGIAGPVLIGSVLSFIGAYLSVRFLTKYFSESKSLRPFGFYCLGFGVLAFLYLVVASLS